MKNKIPNRSLSEIREESQKLNAMFFEGFDPIPLRHMSANSYVDWQSKSDLSFNTPTHQKKALLPSPDLSQSLKRFHPPLLPPAQLPSTRRSKDLSTSKVPSPQTLDRKSNLEVIDEFFSQQHPESANPATSSNLEKTLSRIGIANKKEREKAIDHFLKTIDETNCKSSSSGSDKDEHLDQSTVHSQLMKSFKTAKAELRADVDKFDKMIEAEKISLAQLSSSSSSPIPNSSSSLKAQHAKTK